ncbi:protein kinase [Sorangium cellulosum]|uniref:non-specific serine/threonine protein kinase n=2 Tax=Sorangium cellulosum TaxID=56 RepID=A0A150QTS4_SORCE|nr:protein kinase [Sorangium cellulosum]
MKRALVRDALHAERSASARMLRERESRPIGGRRSVLAAHDTESVRRAVRRAFRVALWIWPAFTLVDVFMATVLYPAAPVWRCIVLRVVEQALAFTVYRLAGRPTVSGRVVLLGYDAAFLSAAIFISLMALDFGGLTSAYMHGLSIVVLLRTALVPAPFGKALVASAPMFLAFPATMGIAALFSPSILASWLDPTTLLTAASHYIFVPASGVIGALSSHVVWAAQQQVYQARKLGRYRLEAPIGKGGMSEVWLAWDETLQRDVALKLLRTRDAPDAAVLRRFEQEAHAASKLSDPHTIRIFDFGASDDGIYYIAMERLRGADLAAIVRSYGPMPVARALRFALQACRSLIEAHEAGIIHRDIKPQNLFVTRVGDDHDFLKLLDFGVARMVEGGRDAELTNSGMLCGTPAYMAPEVCRGDRADARSDIYSLGGTLYFLLTGELPFEGSSSGQLFAAHMTKAPAAPSVRRGPAVPRAVDRLVLRCLAKDPRHRFQSARTLFDALLPLLDESAWSAADAERFWAASRAEKLGHPEVPPERVAPTRGGSTRSATAR